MKYDATRRCSAILLLPLAALGNLGCAGSSSDADAGEPGVTPDPRCEDEFNGPLDPSALIDDLEDGDGLIAQAAGRNGGWWISSDGTQGALTPPADMQPPAERILGGRCDSEYAMRVTGADFTDWGAVLSLGFRFEGQQEPVDLSDFEGVRFWARVGETNSSSIRLQFQDATTHFEGGLCSEEPGDGDECWDGWGIELAPIDTEWQLYQIRFATLSQRGYGLPGDEFKREAIYSLDFTLEPNSVFDLWLDDLWLFE